MGQCFKKPFIGSDAIAAKYLATRPEKAAKEFEREGDYHSAVLVWLAQGDLQYAKSLYNKHGLIESDFIWYSPTKHSFNHPLWELLLACEAQDGRAIQLRISAFNTMYGLQTWKKELLHEIGHIPHWKFE